ncbi:RNA 2',3'-cyclic phosphodiesterase [Salinisphaera sp. SWV1]|uniref:RNA 2',3'-cyclic phosphodiesterase n=1 Tax=Salinisphaera sp. SWV1 TaxID=3454139 RepID=UPI003F84AAA0
MTAGDTSGSQRLFFALWPPPDAARRIADLGAALDAGGAPVACDKLHLTLAFHGNCDAAGREALIARAECVSAAPIDLVFDRLDSFSKPRLIWLGPSDPPQALIDLAAFLRGPGLDRRRFVPHITLQRKAAPIAARPVAPIAWRAREFVLAESGAHGVAGAYRVLARWPLAGEAGPLANVK